MYRRSFLATAGAAATGMTGCSALADDASPDRPWPPSDPVDDPDGIHDLFVENHTDATETAWLRVGREDDAVLVDGRYELPDGRAIRFEDVAAWETAYTIDLAIDGEERRALAWYPDACGRDSEAPGGSRNAAVVVAERTDDGGRVRLEVDQCDAIVAGSVPAGSAESFRLDA